MCAHRYALETALLLEMLGSCPVALVKTALFHRQGRKLKLKCCCDLRAHYYEGEAWNSLDEGGSWVEKGPIIRPDMKKQGVQTLPLIW